MITEILIWALAVGAIIASGLFSGLETGIYSLNRVRLHILEHQRNRNARIIQYLMANSSTLLVTLLISNNIVNNLATSAVGKILGNAGCSSLEIIVYDILILTPLLFIFAETLPKDLFNVHADRFVYPFARFLLMIKWALTLCGILPLATLLGSLTMRLLGGNSKAVVFHPRMQVATLVREGVGYGLLSDEQSALTGRVLRLVHCSLEDEMTPWSDVVRLDITATTDTIWDYARKSSLSRYPVIDEQGNVQGMMSLHETLLYGKDNCPPIRELLQPLPQMDVTVPLRVALRQLQDSQSAMGLVVKDNKPVGIVTVKDLVEPITGELTSW